MSVVLDKLRAVRPNVLLNSFYAFLVLSALVWQHGNPFVVNYVFSYPWCLVTCIGDYIFHFGISFAKPVVKPVKGNAVVYVPEI